jgi:hypothetical protein
MVHAFAFFRGVCCVLCHSNKIQGSSCVHEPVSSLPPLASPRLAYRPSPSNCLGDAGTTPHVSLFGKGRVPLHGHVLSRSLSIHAEFTLLSRADSGITEFLEAFWGG